MKSMRELRDAVKNNKPLIWKDRSPIEGNDYRITTIEPIRAYYDKDTPIVITYNGGKSTAEVFMHEIEHDNSIRQ